ncbi:class I adenylate-forming enzyme family protein [Auritidibacter ignavus]|uniref:class I adenylate-forming enzyme family protein n=1 Tax=Auritidibacter ignavus TaxID=678932 RepID=UPI0024B8DC3C|nr:AMP-binding protein [Auritidibacter ignavus]WHS27108.1 AMP-binding protein [Auritidibacter ignavus]
MDINTTLTQLWCQRVADEPQAIALTDHTNDYTVERTEELTNALGSYFQSRGVEPGQRVGIQLQNTVSFPLCMLALWKIGATPLILNTMYGQHELAGILQDSQAVGLVSSETTGAETATWGLAGTTPWVVAADLTDPSDPDLWQELETFRGTTPTAPEITADTAALLTYTSGTTGPPKGALATHRNLVAVALTFPQLIHQQPGDGVLAVAPLFHITGAVGSATATLTAGRGKLILRGRTRTEVVLDALRRGDVNHMVGSITVYNALLDAPGVTEEDFATLKSTYTGGAPVPPATLRQFEDRFGHYIHNVYGMTETSSAVIGVPLGERAPIHEETASLSIGKTMPDVAARIIGDDGQQAPNGTPGELVLQGPSCIDHYLNNPEATASTIQNGWLYTGDIGILDDEGWIYIVDRRKDQINVSGYKVWPREVEDAIYDYPGVKEAAVVGVADPYSGEKVIAFISVQEGQPLDPEDVRATVRQKLAAFKSPKEIHLLNDLPKTPTGKIQRRVLRTQYTAEPTTS